MNLQTGEYLGGDRRYELVSRLGSGGSSEVWSAKDLHMSGKLVALKIFSPKQVLMDDAVETLQREILLTLDLNHPQILTPLHFEKNNGMPFLVMPLCEGGNLKSQINRQRKFSERELAQIVLQMGAAFHYLHAEGVCHQDIKPENILIVKEGVYKLTDFGISSQTTRSIHEKTVRQTEAMDSAMQSTLSFAAPEKWTSSSATPEMDIFSFGVTLYEATIGSLPFELPGFAMERGAILPELPSPYSKGLWYVIEKCMRLKPQDRPTGKQLNEWGEGFLKNGQWYNPAKSGKSGQWSSPAKSGNNGPKKKKPVAVIMTVLSIAAIGGSVLFCPFIKDKLESITSSDNGGNPVPSDNLTALKKITGGMYEGEKVPVFSIEEHEVTNEQFCLFLNEKFTNGDADFATWIGIGMVDCAISFDSRAKRFLTVTGKEDFPATYVSFKGAQAYAEWVGRKLPSIAQWNMASRAEDLKKSWHEDNSEGEAHPVKQGGSSPSDLFGNVAEWTQSSGQPTACGGHYLSNLKELELCEEVEPNAQEPTIGFRCVVD